MKRKTKKNKQKQVKQNLKNKNLIKNLSFKDIKNYLQNILKTTKFLILDNKLLFVYVFGAVLNGVILRVFTIGNWYSLRPLLADLAITLVFASIYFLVKKRYRFLYLLAVSLTSILVCLANIVYYFYFSSFISITFFSFALTNTETGDSNVVLDLLNPKIFIFLWLPVALFIANKKEKKHKNDSAFKRVPKKMVFRAIYTWVIVITVIFLATLKPVDYSRLYSQWNREYLVSRFGLYVYQINDIVKSLEPKMATLFGKDKAYRDITNFYEYEKPKDKRNEYTNIFKNKNVIAVHAESIQNTLIDLKIGNKQITPNLNKLAKEGLYFNNFYSQVSLGTSSDTEFTLATSLLPVSTGTVFINHADKTYESFYKQLQNKGYYTFSMHANTGDFWNRNQMHKNLGYNKFYDKSSYIIDEEIGFGLSDESFIKQSVKYIKQINKENKKFYGTLITLSNHTPFDYNEKYGVFPVTMTKKKKVYPYMKDTKLGKYFISSHYADKQLGLLVKELEKENILEDTIIVIYGDHDARISTYLWNRFYNYDYINNKTMDKDNPKYKELDYYWQEQNRRVPLIIWSSDKDFQNNYSKKVKTTMGMYDLAPTLGNMLGVKNKYALGSDILSKKDNLVTFSNGNFVTNYVYYNDNKGEYKLLKNKPLAESYIEKNKELSQKYIDISNDIVVYNYFAKDKTKYKEEQ